MTEGRGQRAERSYLRDVIPAVFGGNPVRKKTMAKPSNFSAL
jgi:hypothetical protein